VAPFQRLAVPKSAQAALRQAGVNVRLGISIARGRHSATGYTQSFS